MGKDTYRDDLEPENDGIQDWIETVPGNDETIPTCGQAIIALLEASPSLNEEGIYAAVLSGDFFQKQRPDAPLSLGTVIGSWSSIPPQNPSFYSAYPTPIPSSDPLCKALMLAMTDPDNPMGTDRCAPPVLRSTNVDSKKKF
jgi:hypothetical protein